MGALSCLNIQPLEALTVVVGRAVDEEELLALEQPRLGGEVGVLVVTNSIGQNNLQQKLGQYIW